MSKRIETAYLKEVKFCLIAGKNWQEIQNFRIKTGYNKRVDPIVALEVPKIKKSRIGWQ